MTTRMQTTLELRDGADDVASTVRFKTDPSEPRQELVIAKGDWELLGRPSRIALTIAAVETDVEPVG